MAAPMILQMTSVLPTMALLSTVLPIRMKRCPPHHQPSKEVIQTTQRQGSGSRRGNNIHNFNSPLQRVSHHTLRISRTTSLHHLPLWHAPLPTQQETTATPFSKRRRTTNNNIIAPSSILSLNVIILEVHTHEELSLLGTNFFAKQHPPNNNTILRWIRMPLPLCNSLFGPSIAIAGTTSAGVKFMRVAVQRAASIRI